VHLFLTGANGSVGLEVLRALRDDARVKRITCLIRGNEKESAMQRWQNLIDKHDLLHTTDTHGPVLECLEGNLLEHHFALGSTELESITASVTHVLHAAAHIQFDALYEEAYAVNVEGTRRMIEVAKLCPKLRSFGHVSTLYVVGTRQGKLPEDAVPEGEFNNAYEQTKYEAEQLVLASGLPVDIYRLSLLQGRATDGYVHHFLESHMLMNAFCRGFCSRLPGTPQGRLDMLPTDYTASALVKLITEHAPCGRVWSIAAGDDAPSISDIYELICQLFIARGSEVPTQPIYIDQATLTMILQSDDPREYGLSPGTCAILEVTSGYLLRPKIFTPSIIPGFPRPPLHAVWMRSVLDYCINTGWGRRV
jgi:long-chain acyl-CoA synthetase